MQTKPAISTESPIVNLDVLVTDEDGLVLGGLKKENLRVLADGKPQTVSQFEPIGAPYLRMTFKTITEKNCPWVQERQLPSEHTVPSGPINDPQIVPYFVT